MEQFVWVWLSWLCKLNFLKPLGAKCLVVHTTGQAGNGDEKARKCGDVPLKVSWRANSTAYQTMISWDGLYIVKTSQADQAVLPLVLVGKQLVQLKNQ